MMRSLYSAISGLKNHQIKMDVVGDNIANVNTAGFKRSRVTFSTMLSQTTKGASAASSDPERGGTNAIQIGLGAAIASIDRVMSQGSNQYTGQKTDMMLQGAGFFILDNGGVQVYTRAGSFGLDTNGTLIDPATGALVLGWVPNDTTGVIDTTGEISKLTIKIGDHPLFSNLPAVSGTPVYYSADNYKLDSYSIDQAGVITGVYTYDGPNLSGVPNPPPKSITGKIGQVAIATFANEAGLESVGNNFFRETNNSGDAEIGGAGTAGRALIVPNTIEMSNVDLSQEMTDMIVTQRGFQANSRVITVSDTLLEELINLKR